MMNRLFHVFLPAVIFFSVSSFNTKHNMPVSVSPVPAADSVVTISLSFTGDLMCHAPQFSSAFVEKDSFDFSPVYRYVTPYLSEADYTFGNLETVTAGRENKYTGYPNFNTPVNYIDALKSAGFDFMFTSNNHTLDRGERGVLMTAEALNKRGIGYTGTAVSERDRDSLRIVNVRGIRIALLSYTYGTNSNRTPAGKEYLVNMIDEQNIIKDIRKAKSLPHDVLLVYLHQGEEYKREPSEYQQKLAAAALSAGAGIIIGSHPHVLQKAGFTVTADTNMNRGFVAYSLGNFISNQRDRYTAAGVILSLRMSKNFTTGRISLDDALYLPTVVFKGFTGEKDEYVIIPDKDFSADKYPFLGADALRNVRQSFEDTNTMFSNLKKK
ncbi:MAG: CapA family protein [Bacteroidota bacterium]